MVTIEQVLKHLDGVSLSGLPGNMRRRIDQLIESGKSAKDIAEIIAEEFGLRVYRAPTPSIVPTNPNWSP